MSRALRPRLKWQGTGEALRGSLSLALPLAPPASTSSPAAPAPG